MKKLLLLTLTLPFSLGASTWREAHSFFMPRASSSDLLLTSQNGSNAGETESAGLTLSHTAFYKSSEKGDNIAPYFFGSAKKSLVFDEEGKGDINPRWVSVWADGSNNFKSTVTINPHRTQWGIVLGAQQKIPTLHKGMWLSLAAPVVEVTHKLNLSEAVETTDAMGALSFKNVTQGLDFDNWRAGKWASSSQTIRGIDDLLVQLGINIGDDESLSFYLESSLPMSNRPTAQYLFEPVIGSGGFIGLGGGMKTVFLLGSVSNVACSYIGHQQYRYYFSSEQKRTFDLKGQPLSRYLIFLDTIQGVNDNYSLYSANGVNFFTRSVSVDPGSSGQSMNALRLAYKNHTVNLGYNFWWRTAEQVNLIGSVQRTFAVPVSNAPTSGRQWLPSPLLKETWHADALNSAHVQIATTAADAVTDNELDMSSGAVPFTSSHTLFIHYSGDFSWNENVITIDLGGSYEMADNAASLNSIGGWISFGLQF